MKFNHFFLALIVGSSAVVHSQTCTPPKQKMIVYQPWTSHSQIPTKEIRIISRQLDKANYSHLLVQWSRYGAQSYWQGMNNSWFPLQMKQIRRQLVEGLYADPNFFQALNLSDPELEVYLGQLREKSLAESRAFMLEKPFRISAWYLPEEIDDLNWRSTARQTLLSQHFKTMVSTLKRLSPNKPVYASTFFGGHTTPQEYANLLKKIHQETGIIWIVQDGQGVFRNPKPKTAAYLRAVQQTLPAKAWLGLLENFTELDATTENRFCPASNAEITERRKLWCSATGREPDVYFSLNQLNDELLGHANQKCKTRVGHLAPN